MPARQSQASRSFNMSQIRSKNTKPELTVRKFLYAQGFKYRLHRKDLPGKPDIILSKYKTVIFVHGCFWHRHSGCRYAFTPKSNTEYWLPKLHNNVLKDKANIEKLQRAGWRVIIIWECDLKGDKIQPTLSSLIINIVGRENQE